VNVQRLTTTSGWVNHENRKVDVDRNGSRHGFCSGVMVQFRRRPAAARRPPTRMSCKRCRVRNPRQLARVFGHQEERHRGPRRADAEDVGKFPDKNLAEALQRVPGVVINREFGEGERINLRGTARR